MTGTVKSVVVSDDLIVYVSTDIVKALGPMLESIVTRMQPGAAVSGSVQAGIRDSLGELLTETAFKSGFWISFPQGDSGPQISSPGI